MAGQDYPPRRQSVAVLMLLMLITFLSFIDRQIPNFLVAPIRISLGISDTQMSFIQGLSFAITFSLVGMPLGWLADRSSRRNLIAAGCLIWSGGTVCCGFAGDFSQLFFGRVMVGLGEAALAPAAYSLLADIFEPRVRGRILAIYFLATTSSVGLALVLIAVMLRIAPDLAALAPPLASLEPWQLAFLLAGMPGIILTPLIFLIPEPVRRAVDGTPLADSRGASAREFTTYLRVHRSAFLPVLSAFALLQFANVGSYSWMPSLYIRKFGMSAVTIGSTLGWVVTAAGVSGTLIAAMFSDSLAAAEGRGGRARLMLIAALIMFPGQLTWAIVPDRIFSMILFGFAGIGIAMAAASASAILQDIVPNRMRGKIIALYSLVIGLIGYGFAPSAVALFTDHVFGRDDALPLALISALGPAAFLAVIAAAFALQPFSKAVRAAANG